MALIRILLNPSGMNSYYSVVILFVILMLYIFDNIYDK